MSEVGGRSGESFVSPTDQRDRFAEWCHRNDADLVDVFDEIDISAKLPLAKRKGLRAAVELVESGGADILLFAYFDRSFRNLDVQMAVLARVIDAGGTTVACDFGEIRISTPAERFSTTVQGAANQFYSDQTAYKVMNAKRNAVARGVPPFSRITRGYRRGPGGRIVVHPIEGPLITQAFSKRADGMTIAACRDWLAERGLSLSYSSMKATFASKMVLGELHAGALVNLESHEPLVDRVTWQRVQRQKVSRGRPALGDPRLLSRLALLRCSGCTHAMSLSWTMVKGKKYVFYTCARRPDCPQAVTIMAPLVEDLVAAECRRWLAERFQTANIEAEINAAEAELERRQALLESTGLAFKGVDVAAFNVRLIELQDGVNAAIDELNRLRAAVGPSELISAGRDWDRLTLDEQRALVRTTFKSVTVAPSLRRLSRAAAFERLTFEPFVE